MKTILVAFLFLTLALNSFANEIVALKTNNRPLSGDLAGVKECQVAEVSEDEITFTSYFYEQDPATKKTLVHAIVKSESLRKKVYAVPTYTDPVISVINPPDADLGKLTFDGQPNKDKSKVLDLSLKLCIAKTNEKKLTDINLFLQSELVTAAQIVQSVPEALKESYQMGYIQGLSEDAVKSFVKGRTVGQIEGLVVGYLKGVADGLKVNDQNSAATVVNAVARWNSRSGSEYTYSDYKSASRFTSSEGALTRENRDRVLGGSAHSAITTQDADRTK